MGNRDIQTNHGDLSRTEDQSAEPHGETASGDEDLSVHQDGRSTENDNRPPNESDADESEWGLE